MGNIFETEVPIGRVNNKNTKYRTSKKYHANTLTVYVDGVFVHDIDLVDDNNFTLRVAPVSKITVQYISLGE